MRESIFETFLGLIVIGVAGAFLYFALNTTSSASNAAGRYEVSARFNSISGVDRGTDVRLAGVKVGIVTDVQIDPQRYEAVVRMSIDDTIELPDDTDARISTDGLLGGAYVAIEPGGGFDVIAKDGSGEIIYTRGSVDLLTLFASFAAQGNGGDSE